MDQLETNTISLVFTVVSLLQLIEEIMRSHLGWLVIWGNVFGAVLGVLAEIIPMYATGSS